MATKAFSYLRVSGMGQREGDGFPRQRLAVTRYAKAHRIQVLEEFRDEGVSGGEELADRDGLTALFAKLDGDGVRLVLVERSDRLARELMVGEVILQQFRDRGVRVVECEGGQDLTVSDGDPTKTLIRQILGAVAEFDKSCIVAKLRGARDRKAKKDGRRCEGRKPYGTREGELQVVEQIKRLRAEGLSFHKIAAQLNDQGIRARGSKCKACTGGEVTAKGQTTKCEICGGSGEKRAKWGAQQIKLVCDRS